MTNSVVWDAYFEFIGAVWRYREGGPHALHQLADDHSAYYLNTDVVTSTAAALDRVAEGLAAIAGEAPTEWIVAPLTSIGAALVLATTVAGRLGRRVGYVDVGSRTLPSPILAGETVTVVTDDVHGGGSVATTIAVLQARGAEVRGPVLALADFSSRPLPFEVRALVELRMEKWKAADCPLCARGSKALPARARWRELRR